MSKGQKKTMRELKLELHSDIIRCEKFYGELEDALHSGLMKRARKVIKENKGIEGKLAEASENINLMVKEIEDGKSRLMVS